MQQDCQYEFVLLPRCVLNQLLETVLHIAAQPELSAECKQMLSDMARKILEEL